jgi:hypothetical protein
MLETILGFLDVRALCTARLVCIRFFTAASRFLHTLELSADRLCTGPRPDFRNFPRLCRVMIPCFDLAKHDLSLLVRSGVSDEVTHLGLELPCPSGVPPSTHHVLPPLPKLVSLIVFKTTPNPGMPFEFPVTLRDLRLDNSNACPHADPLIRLTGLTNLRISLAGYKQKPFEALSALTALQVLFIQCESSLIPSVAGLMLLTHLTILSPEGDKGWAHAVVLASLSGLCNLAHLGVGPLLLERLTQVGKITTLKSLKLDLRGGHQGTNPDAVPVGFLSGLTSLALFCQHPNLPFLQRFNVEGLSALDLSCPLEVGVEAVAALGRATALKYLILTCRSVNVKPVDLLPALSRMPRLQLLCLKGIMLTTPCFEVIGRLTA